MENKSGYSPVSVAAAIAVFTAADSLVLMPVFKKNILPFIISCVAGVLMLWAAQKPLKGLINIKNKTARDVFYVLAAIISLAVAFLAAGEYAKLIYADVLEKGNMFFIKFVFAVCVFSLASVKRRAMYKFSLLSAVFVSVIFIVMFLISVKNFDIKNLRSAVSFGGISCKQVIYYFCRLFLPLFIAVLFIEEDKRLVLPRFLLPVSVFYAALLCNIVVFDSVLSFSLPLAAKLTYPYIDDISTVTIGSLFTRMDGFAYFAFFVCYIFKCAVSVRLSADLLNKTGVKNKRAMITLFSVLLLF